MSLKRINLRSVKRPVKNLMIMMILTATLLLARLLFNQENQATHFIQVYERDTDKILIKRNTTEQSNQKEQFLQKNTTAQSNQIEHVDVTSTDNKTYLNTTKAPWVRKVTLTDFLEDFVTPMKKILLWNSFFLAPDYGFGVGMLPFKEAKCSNTCFVTTNRSELANVDAVVVHAFHLAKDLANASLPKRASPKQIFVFFVLENPHRSYTGLVNMEYNDLFNLTFTYLDDPMTDIHAPYGRVIKRKEIDDDAVPTIETLKTKTKLVTWLLSNCRAPSARYEYAEKLKAHVPIDVYGKCGNDSCPRNEKCMAMLQKDYMFYLAFENGHCRDYITEKAFRTLETTNLVPIVLGGGNYTKQLPPHSFIDVRDFPSPKKLAEYLLRLQKNIGEYSEYFLWKRDYTISTAFMTKRTGFCQLCNILNNDTYKYKSGFEPLSYWNPEHCRTGDDEREAIGLF